MSEMKYSQRIITDAVPLGLNEKGPAVPGLEDLKSIKSTHLMNVDSSRMPDFFYVDCYCLWQGGSESKLDIPHIHDSDEVIGLVGTNPDDPYDLGGEVAVWLDNERQVLTRTSLIYIPAGTLHCPIQFLRIDRPIYYFTVSPTGTYRRIPASESVKSAASGKAPRSTVISRTKEQFTVAADGTKAPPAPPNPDLKGARVLHLEDDMAAGAFYVDVVFLYSGVGAAPAPRHSHEWPELIAMAGCDPEHPNDIGGLMTIDLDGEVHEITRSSLVCIPAGLNHCPWKFVKINRPTMAFTAGPSAMYTGTHKKEVKQEK